jgi:glycosyltransferase involved in cell wall biosynthesis
LVTDTVNEWIELVVALLKNNEERQRIAENGRKFVMENYSWAVQIEKLKQIIEL